MRIEGRAALPEIGRFASNTLMPNYGLFDVVMFLAAFTFASSFILGLFVRVAGFGGLVAGLALWLGVYGEVAGGVLEPHLQGVAALEQPRRRLRFPFREKARQQPLEGDALLEAGKVGGFLR